MKQLIITFIATILVSLGVVVLGTASQAHAEEDTRFPIPASSVSITFRQHSCTGAGVIDTGAGWYSTKVEYRVYWPSNVNQLETSYGGDYPATVHYWQHNPTRDHRGKKVSGVVAVKALPKKGYKWDTGVNPIRKFRFTPRSC